MIFIILCIIIVIIIGIKFHGSVGDWIFLLIVGPIFGTAFSIFLGAILTSGYICTEPTTPQVYTPIQMNEYYIINNEESNVFYTKDENSELKTHEIYDSAYKHEYKFTSRGAEPTITVVNYQLSPVGKWFFFFSAARGRAIYEIPPHNIIVD